MATAEVQEIRATSYVGFDSITQQIEHKLLKRGFQFNVIVVGASPIQYLPYFTWQFSDLNVSGSRSDRSGEVDTHQHHICITPHRFEGEARRR